MRVARNDFVSCADELIESGWKRGHKQGIEQGIEQGVLMGRQEGRQQGRWEAMLEMARALYQQGYTKELILNITGLSENDIAVLC